MVFNFRSKIFALTAAGLCFLAGAQANPHRHVVVVVWDGMRPDFVNAQNTPTLWQLSQDGVTFKNHHAVYTSATNVNGTTIATGDYPGRTGLIANHEFRPGIDKQKSLDVEIPEVVEKGDAISGGKYIAVPTIAEIVRQAGGRTIVASAKTVGLLLDRKADGKNGVTFAAGRIWPNELLGKLTAMFGPFPKSHTKQDDWTTNAVTDVFWAPDLPTFSLLWLGEPDLTQHETAPGAPEAISAIRSADDDLGVILKKLDQMQVRENTDLFIVSDHGFSTIEHSIDLRKILRDAGFSVVTEFKGEPQPDEIMMVGVGGSVLFYLAKDHAALGQRLVEFLQQSDYAGVIFTKTKIEGTFSLAQAHIDSADAPDIVMAFRWDENKNQFGIPGMIEADWQRGAGKGTHATLSRFDMHNTLIAVGPDFQKGLTSELASGNVDVAPTILHVLGMSASQTDGRILSEGLIGQPKPPPAETRTVEATKKFQTGTWKQTMQTSQVGKTIYLDQGNGEFRRSGSD